MGNLEQIEKSAQKLIALCQKEKPTKTDKAKMLGLHTEILNGIENLVECEICGAITETIVTMTLVEVTAKLCKECGFKALESGKIQKTAARKRTRTTKTTKSKPKSAKTEPKPTVPEPEAVAAEPETPAALHSRIEEETGIKKTDAKRLHKIVQEIATPMNLENTMTYVKREVENAKLKVDASALQKAVEILIAA